VRTFFDPTLLENWHGSGFLSENKIEDGLRRLMPGAHLSTGSFSCPGHAEIRDLVWNHMDQNHRPFIHRTYDAAVRVHIGSSSAFSLTRFGRLPFWIPVFDGHFKQNGFYQVICLFGLFVVVIVIECNGEANDTRMDVRWVIASHRLLRLLHGPLHRRLVRLNDVQNLEDDEIRRRRVELRAANYRFGTDEPDFVNSNVVANNVVFPSLQKQRFVPMSELPDGQAVSVAMDDRSFVVRRSGAEVEIWPGVCPHEGAQLEPAGVKGNRIVCRWHGLEFAARRLKVAGPPVSVCGARLSLNEQGLTIGPSQDARTAVQ
jgi:nitrite reductase/ring-hydroxylating ferredoxin subunit